MLQHPNLTHTIYDHTRYTTRKLRLKYSQGLHVQILSLQLHEQAGQFKNSETLVHVLSTRTWAKIPGLSLLFRTLGIFGNYELIYSIQISQKLQNSHI